MKISSATSAVEHVSVPLITERFSNFEQAGLLMAGILKSKLLVIQVCIGAAVIT